MAKRKRAGRGRLFYSVRVSTATSPISFSHSSLTFLSGKFVFQYRLTFFLFAVRPTANDSLDVKGQRSFRASERDSRNENSLILDERDTTSLSNETYVFYTQAAAMAAFIFNSISIVVSAGKHAPHRGSNQER